MSTSGKTSLPPFFLGVAKQAPKKKTDRKVKPLRECTQHFIADEIKQRKVLDLRRWYWSFNCYNTLQMKRLECFFKSHLKTSCNKAAVFKYSMAFTYLSSSLGTPQTPGCSEMQFWIFTESWPVQTSLQYDGQPQRPVGSCESWVGSLTLKFFTKVEICILECAGFVVPGLVVFNLPHCHISIVVVV